MEKVDGKKIRFGSSLVTVTFRKIKTASFYTTFNQVIIKQNSVSY